jgi:pepF/M3 family oligoendopeptidase
MTSSVPATEALPHWDLSNVYPGLDSREFLAAVADVAARLDSLERYMATHGIAPNAPETAANGNLATIVGSYIEQVNDLLSVHLTASAYVRAMVATDSFNTEARRWQSRLEQYSVQLRQHSLRFEAWLGREAGALPDILSGSAEAREHAFFLRETIEQSRYLMSEAEEALAAELSLSGEYAWSKLQGTVASQLTVPFERDGKTETMPIAALQNLQHDPDADVRRRAYEAELAAWRSVSEPLAAAMNGVKGSKVVLNRRRGRSDALHSALDQARIDRETLETMLAAMQASFPSFRGYLRAKAARLGYEGGLPWWDLQAPVEPAGEAGQRHFSFAEAETFVLEQFATFSPRLAALAQRAFRQRWIDAEPRKGKRGGAFCMYLPAVKESRVLCNFDGSLDQVFTVAHELGHAYHNECLADKRELQTITPMTLAETASTLCETIVTEAALASAASQTEELAILDTFLIGATGIIVDISSRFLFERQVFERRAEAELSADELCELMLGCQAETYGDGLDERYRHEYMWAWKPHYYRPELQFYNFPYAFGLLFGIGLYSRFQQQGPSFVPECERLLASTGEATPLELAARFGIDLRTSEFWESGLKVIESRIERYLAL